MGVPAFCVGVGQPGDELANLLVGARAGGEVPVIGHEAIGEDGDGGASEGIGHDALEGGQVLVFVEERAAADTAAEHMEDHACGELAKWPGHVEEVNGGAELSQRSMAGE